MELEVKGHKYRTGTLNAKEQFHVVRRLGRVTAALQRSVDDLRKVLPTVGQPDPGASVPPALPDAVPVSTILGVAEPFLIAMAELSDADANYVLDLCMSRANRAPDSPQQGWAAVYSNGQLMFADIGLSELLRLTWATLQENLGGFFAELSSFVPAKGS